MTEERKLVTVLFADIVGSTVHGSANDPEIVRRTLGTTFDRAREIPGKRTYDSDGTRSCSWATSIRA